ncbi:MAG: DUF5011 domain-containing protein [Gammaproteobacteria bacterium]|nr:DUF5011 domain-containing protein [Gammaproteobacteria bacterium]
MIKHFLLVFTVISLTLFLVSCGGSGSKDIIQPVITLNGDNPMTLEHGEAYTEPGATVTDNVDTGLTVTISGNVDTSILGTYELNYDVSDAAGNAAITVTRIVNVVDTTAPVITLIGNSQITIAHGATFTDSGTTVIDNVDTDLTALVTGEVDTSTIGEYILTYNVTDAAGNAAIAVTRTVTVTDMTAPVITLIGDAPMEVRFGVSFTDPGATVTDNVDSELIAIVTGTVDTSTAGTYTLEYNVMDAAGNAATLVTRTVNVLPLADKLYTIEMGCDCILSITTEGDINILVSQDVLNDLFELPDNWPSTDDILPEVILSQTGLVSSADGSLYFPAKAPLDGEDGGNSDVRLVKRASDGTLSVVSTATQIKAATLEDEVELAGLVFGIDGYLYLTEEESDSLIKMDINTGQTTVLVTKSEFEALEGIDTFSSEAGMTADENFIYLASNASPDTTFRVSYDGTPEIFASGPGVDPTISTTQIVAVAIEDTVISGNLEFLICNDANFGECWWVGNVPFNASTADLKALFDAERPGIYESITGFGTENSAWVITFTKGMQLTNINEPAALVGGSFKIVFKQVDGTHRVTNHVEAMAVDSCTEGNYVQIDIDFNHGAQVYEKLRPYWPCDATAAEVKDAIESDSDFVTSIGNVIPENAGDTYHEGGEVEVTGEGTLESPWIMTWKGAYAKIKPTYEEGSMVYLVGAPGDPDFDINNSDGNDQIYVGTMENTIAFDDADGFMTRRENGSIIIADDGGAHMLYEIDETTGETSIFVDEFSLTLANGGPLDMESGMAFDALGVLHVATESAGDPYNSHICHADDCPESPAAIFRIQPDTKEISHWLDANDVAAVTGETELNNIKFAGMVFEPIP